ncbi:MAG: hypothetical protein E6K13_06080 [Methanobacteriota archaeon]|nr:MAG: hypothetical protein E6K13_06080 [Euryarchaeota archaeon]
MVVAESGQGAKGTESIEIDHWLYGSQPGEGYTTKAVSRGMSVGLYDNYLRGHYTPIRAATAQEEGTVNIWMIHPVGSGEELLLSRMFRGPADEAGRPTFANHTAVVTTELLRSGRLTLEGVYRALEAFDKKNPRVAGEMAQLSVPIRPAPEAGTFFGFGVHRSISLPALETLATRMMTDPRSRTLLLSRDSTPESRNRTLCSAVELLNWACGLPLFTAISDSPTSSALKFFKLVVAPRGVRADSSWALLESAIGEPALPRVPGRDDVYDVLATAFRQSLSLPSTR